MAWLSLAVVFSCALLAGGGEEAGGSPRNAELRGASGTTTTASSKGGVTVRGAIGEAELGPAGDSDVHARALFKEVGNLGVQIELEVSGLPTKNPGVSYYAQLHEGVCPDERMGEEHQQEEHSTAGTVLPLVRFDRLLAKA